jgi:hypothetical protein
MKTKLAGLISLFVLCAQMHALANKGWELVSQKVLIAFQKAFPSAEKVDWSEDGDHYYVHFKDHQIVSEIEYDHDGNFISSERYYSDGSQLPLHLTWDLRRKFHDKTIYGITETNTEDETFYYVKLQDAKEWITVKGSADGFIKVVERFNKQ